MTKISIFILHYTHTALWVINSVSPLSPYVDKEIRFFWSRSVSSVLCNYGNSLMKLVIYCLHNFPFLISGVITSDLYQSSF